MCASGKIKKVASSLPNFSGEKKMKTETEEAPKVVRTAVQEKVEEVAEEEKQEKVEEEAAVEEVPLPNMDVSFEAYILDEEEDTAPSDNGKLYVGKPDKRIPIQTNKECRGEIYTIDTVGEDGDTELYLIDPRSTSLITFLQDARDPICKRQACILCAPRTGSNFFWTVPVVTDGAWYDGNSWWTSAVKIMFGRESKELAGKWFRVIAGQRNGDGSGKYTAKVISGQDGDPVFTKGKFFDLIFEAFGDRVISDVDHPVIRNCY